jgi:hypothetical protein
MDSEVLNIINMISDKKRADALEKIDDILYAKASQSLGDYKKTVANTFFDEPTEVETPTEE